MFEGFAYATTHVTYAGLIVSYQFITLKKVRLELKPSGVEIV